MIAIMRHAETISNLTCRRQGWEDTPLTPEGHRQAQVAGRALRGRFSHILCSDLGRARMTAGLLDLGIPVVVLPQLRERDWRTEADEDVVRRLTDFVEREDLEGSLIITHGRTARMLEAILTAAPLSAIRAYRNCETREFIRGISLFATYCRSCG